MRRLFHFLGWLLASESSSLQPSFLLLSARREERRYHGGDREERSPERFQPVPRAGKLAQPLLCRDSPATALLRCSTGTQAWVDSLPPDPCSRMSWAGTIFIPSRPGFPSTPDQLALLPSGSLGTHHPAPSIAFDSCCPSGPLLAWACPHSFIP